MLEKCWEKSYYRDSDNSEIPPLVGAAAVTFAEVAVRLSRFCAYFAKFAAIQMTYSEVVLDLAEGRTSSQGGEACQEACQEAYQEA